MGSNQPGGTEQAGQPRVAIGSPYPLNTPRVFAGLRAGQHLPAIPAAQEWAWVCNTNAFLDLGVQAYSCRRTVFGSTREARRAGI